jgi:LAO/AO transport system kinase
MIDMDQRKYEEGSWKPPILKAEAVFDKGVVEMLEEVENHGKYLMESTGGLPFRRRKEKVREELAEMVKNRLIQEVFEQVSKTGEFEEAVDSIVNGETDPYTACDSLILPKLGLSKS